MLIYKSCNCSYTHAHTHNTHTQHTHTHKHTQTHMQMNVQNYTAKRMHYWTPLFALVLIMTLFVPPNKISYSGSNVCTSKLARNNLPILKGKDLSRRIEIVKLAERLKLEMTHIVNIFGQGACGESTLAISVGYQMASCGIPVYYIDLSETQLLSAPSDVKRGYMYTDELVEWAADLSTDTLLILDNCKLPESMLSNMLVQLYETTEINLKIVVTTCQSLTKSRSIFSFQLRELDFNSAITLLRNLTTVQLTDKECRELTHLAHYDPISIKIISGLLSHLAFGDVISYLKKAKSMASPPKEVPIQLSHNQMDITGKGCARYLSMFPGSFDNEAVQQVLSSSGFSDPSYCVQILAKFSLIEQYIHYKQQRFKMPKVVRDFYANMRYELKYNEYETATFQRGFKKYYTQMLGSLINKEDELQLLRIESHNIRYLHS